VEGGGDSCAILIYAVFVLENWRARDIYRVSVNLHGNNYMTDPISDMLARIKNAYAVKKEAIALPHSKMKQGLAQVLFREGFVGEVEKKGRGTKRLLAIKLRYIDGEPAMIDFSRISKPGQRVYVGHDGVAAAKRGFGMAILSTPKGLLTEKEARREKVGGELMCEIW